MRKIDRVSLIYIFTEPHSHSNLKYLTSVKECDKILALEFNHLILCSELYLVGMWLTIFPHIVVNVADITSNNQMPIFGFKICNKVNLILCTVNFLNVVL